MAKVTPKLSFNQRVRLPEAPPQWSVVLGIFLMVMYILMGIAGQSVVATFNNETFERLSMSSLTAGKAVGAAMFILGLLQWANRRLQPDWVAALRLRMPAGMSVFLFAISGIAAAWAIDVAALALRLKFDQIVPPVLSALTGPVGSTWLFAAVFAVLLQPIAEGLLFYGVLDRKSVV